MLCIFKFNTHVNKMYIRMHWDVLRVILPLMGRRRIDRLQVCIQHWLIRTGGKRSPLSLPGSCACTYFISFMPPCANPWLKNGSGIFSLGKSAANCGCSSTKTRLYCAKGEKDISWLLRWPDWFLQFHFDPLLGCLQCTFARMHALLRRRRKKRRSQLRKNFGAGGADL